MSLKTHAKHSHLFPRSYYKVLISCQDISLPYRDIKAEHVTPALPRGEAQARSTDLLDLHPNDAGTIKINRFWWCVNPLWQSGSPLIKMSFFITKVTPVYNRRPGMTYVPVILACEQRKWGEHGLVRVALCFTIIRAWVKWAHEGVLCNFTTEMNSFGQLHWDHIKCANTSFPHVP